MASAYDNSAQGSSIVGDTTLSSASFAVAGSDRYLLVFVGSGAGTPVDPSAVKWGGSGGTSMTQKGSALNLGSFWKWSVWELIAPTAQTSTVHVTWGSSQDERAVFAISFTGVDQSTPTRTVASGTGASTTPSASATSVSGDLVVDGVFWGDSNNFARTITVNGSQTSRQEIEGATLGFEGGGVSTETAAGASTSMDWTISGSIDSWGIFAMALIEASGGGGGTAALSGYVRQRGQIRPRPFAPGVAR